jgi:hypothetical protein
MSLNIEKCSKQVAGMYGVELNTSLHVRYSGGCLDPRRRKQQGDREDDTVKNSQFVIFTM